MEKQNTYTIISLVFLSLIILISFIYINEGSFTGKATQTTIKNITSVGNFDDLITQGLISTSGDCEDFGTMQKANIGSVDGERKLVSGQIEFSEKGCKADISELMKNGKDIQIEGVSISRVGGVDKYVLEPTSTDQEGFVNINGKRVFLEKGDSIVLGSDSGKMEKGNFKVGGFENFSFGPFSTYINKGRVKYDANKKMLELPKGSEIENIASTKELNDIMGEENTMFDIKGENIRISQGFYDKIFSFEHENAKKFTSFSGDMRLHKTKLIEEGPMKYMASIPKGKSLKFPEAGITLESSKQTDCFLFFEHRQKNNWMVNRGSATTFGNEKYYLQSKKGQDIGTMDYIAVTDNKISGHDSLKDIDKDLSEMTRITLENYEFAGIDVFSDKYLKASFGQGDFSIEDGNIYLENVGEGVETNMVLINGKDKLTRMDGDLRLDILGGKVDKEPTSFIVNVPGRSGEIVRGVVGNFYGDAVYSSSFMTSEDYSTNLGEEGAVNIVHTDGSKTSLSKGAYMEKGGVVGVKEGEETIAEIYNILLRKHGRRMNK